MAWNPAQQLYCPNELCQAPNPLISSCCQRCSTPLTKRYLWAITDDFDLGLPGDILADRYLIINKNVVLDTKPGSIPEKLELEKIQHVQYYLKLLPYRLHIPQVYGILSLDNGETQQEVLLLEKPPILVREEVTPWKVELLDDLGTVWSSATSIQQLNWLLQIASLWEPLASEGVASSLLEPNLLRIECSLVRLLELRADLMTPKLYHLGMLWNLILTDSQPSIAKFVEQICSSLVQQEIQSGQQLINILNKAIREIELSQTDIIKIRSINEDDFSYSSGDKISKTPLIALSNSVSPDKTNLWSKLYRLMTASRAKENSTRGIGNRE